MGKKKQDFAFVLFWVVVGMCCQFETFVCGIFVGVCLLGLFFFPNNPFCCISLRTINCSC